MRKERSIASFSILLIAALLLSLMPLGNIETASANPGKMLWSIVDTPSTGNNIIVSPSEVNVIAIGSDDKTFYAVDIPGDLPGGTYPDGKLYKSTDGGVTWKDNLTGQLIADGANLPVWNLAVAPDDVNFLVAVTDGGVLTPGPLSVFASENGGATWYNTNFPALFGGEYVSCVDISVTYGNNNHDIAIGTRDGVPGGRVFVAKMPGFSNWMDQVLLVPPTDVVALKFSPSYTSDSSLVVIASEVLGTFLRLGIRDTVANTTNWAGWTPLELRDTGPLPSPTNAQIITADVELPSDFSGTNPSLRRFYVSTDAAGAPPFQSGVYRVDNTVVYQIKPPTTAPTAGRISSIAYHGAYAEGTLLAGEVTADPATGMAFVWRTSDPFAGTPTWQKSDEHKSPTGGFGSTFANAQLAWNSDGTRAYCGTSSADLVNGGVNMVPGFQCWPVALLNSVALDESAFSVSPYAPAYEQLLDMYDKTNRPKDPYIGNIWNQLSLIDTQISFLSDVAALGAPEIGDAALKDYDILYLASVDNTGGMDSIWRSTSDPLGSTWERVLCIATTNDDIIIRVKQTPYEEDVRSNVIVFADRGTDVVGYSRYEEYGADRYKGYEGQAWDVNHFMAVNDLAVASSGAIYILGGNMVYRYTISGTQTDSAETRLSTGHTIAVPLKNREVDDIPEDWVIVGEDGPPGGLSRVVWADFSETPVHFAPLTDERVELPVPGNVHVIADDRFELNKIVYAATNDVAGNNGKIYRWAIDKSTAWDELGPPNSAFYGLAQRNDVLYGAWISPQVAAITSDTGADRTVYPRAVVPPATEWDYLTVGLPAVVVFTREPSSLKISSNEDNSLWAIDNRAYNWTNGTGCLWAFADTIAKVGPWTTSPASGDFVPVDPVTGRAIEIDFKWRQLSYASAYELEVAKDSAFSIVVLRNANIVPANQLAPECYFPAGGLVPTLASGVAGFGNLEAGHTYYWRVRARVDIAGEAVRSPWSATMYFTVEAGFPVMAEYPTVTLFSPPYGARGVSRSPAFSWSPMPRTSRYEFVLAKDAALQDVVVKTNVPLTSYLYDGELDYGTAYFWQVRVIEPIVSDPSAIGSFTVIAEEKPAETTTEEPAPIPFWVWGVIVLYAILVVAMIVFAMVKPRRLRPKAAAEIKLESADDKPKAAPVIRLESVGDKPRNPIARIWDDMTTGVRRRVAPVDKLDMTGDKPRNPIARTWDNVKMKVRGWRFLRKPGGGSSLDKLE
ncbi:MAG: exo-alpha-sialidase [Dehalococcoidia bacterium]|nr:exo-alpha-sialidase [Dehalococcoidia bacterium]